MRRLVSLLVLLVLVLLPRGGQADRGLDVSQLAHDVLSSDCGTRLKASRAFLQEAPPQRLADIRQALQQQYPAAAAYLRDALVFLQQKELAEATVQSLVKSAVAASTAAVHDLDAERARWAGYVAAYLVHHLPEQSAPARMMIIGYLAERLAQYRGQPEAGAFREELDDLLRIHDIELQVYVAASLLRSEQGNPDRLLPILVAGLQSTEFPVRYTAINVLVAAGMPDGCYNPLDPPERRQEALSRLKQWWEEQARKTRPAP